MKSIKTAVWIRILALLCSLLLLATSVFVTIGQINSAKEKISAAETISETAYAAEVAHYAWANRLMASVYAGAEFTGSTDPTGCVLGKWIYSQDHGTHDSEILDAITEMEPLHKKIHGSAVDVLDLLGTSRDAAILYYQENTQKDISVLVDLLDNVVARTSTLIEESNSAMSGATLLALVLSIVCVAGALLCLFSLVRYVIARIVKPLLLITRESQGLAEGNLTYQLEVPGQDELSQLSRTLGHSVREISGYVHAIDDAMAQLSKGDFNVTFSKPFVGDFARIEHSISHFVGQISGTLEQIGHSATLVSNESNQIAASSQGLSQGATEQAASVQELAAAIGDISRQVEESAGSALKASQISTETAKELEAGKAQMRRMVAAMDGINHASEEIGKIISTIENIAFQTNILALNAAVEAARAGSAGKGFAVVADEVRNLASKSAQASQSTAALIENSIRSVQEGTQIASETARSLEKIVDSSTQSFALIQHISTSAQREAEALTQVSEGINRISGVVQMNTATAEQSAATSQELSSQAQILKDLVEHFRLAASSTDF